MLLSKEIYCSKTFKAFFSCFTQPTFTQRNQEDKVLTHTHKTFKELSEKLCNFYKEASCSPLRRQTVLLSAIFLFFSTCR